MVRYATPPLPNKLTNVYKYGLSQPTMAQWNSPRILSATKSLTYVYQVGTGYRLLNVPLTKLIPHDQCSRLV